MFAKESYAFSKSKNNNIEFYEKIINRNFDNPGKIMSYLNKTNSFYQKQTLLFNHPEFLKA